MAPKILHNPYPNAPPEERLVAELIASHEVELVASAVHILRAEIAGVRAEVRQVRSDLRRFLTGE
jgi:hypothetical protein